MLTESHLPEKDWNSSEKRGYSSKTDLQWSKLYRWWWELGLRKENPLFQLVSHLNIQLTQRYTHRLPLAKHSSFLEFILTPGKGKLKTSFLYYSLGAPSPKENNLVYRLERWKWDQKISGRNKQKVFRQIITHAKKNSQI